jgi:hypothetical protein
VAAGGIARGHFPGHQVFVDVAIEIEPALFDEPQGGDGGDKLG